MIEMPFTNKEFLNVFRQYNLAVWPIQIFLNLFALLILLLLFTKKNKADMLISALLAILWGWTGLIYHILVLLVQSQGSLHHGPLSLRCENGHSLGISASLFCSDEAADVM